MIRKSAAILSAFLLFGFTLALQAEPAAEPEEKADTTEQLQEQTLLDTLGIDVNDKTIRGDETKAYLTIFQSLARTVSEETEKLVSWKGFELRRLLIALCGTVLSILAAFFCRTYLQNAFFSAMIMPYATFAGSKPRFFTFGDSNSKGVDLCVH